MYSLAEYSLHLCNKRPQGFEYPALDVDNVYDWMVLDNNCFDFYLKAKELTEKGWEMINQVRFTDQRMILLRRPRN